MMSTYRISDERWTKLLSFLRSNGRVYVGQEEECRLFIEGVFWIMRSGSQWYSLEFLLTGGQRHDVTQAPELLRDQKADFVIADRGSDADQVIDLIDQMGAIPVIPPRKNRTALRFYDGHLYRERHLIECFFNELKYYRRIFSRFDKLASRYLGFIHFAAILIWLS